MLMFSLFFFSFVCLLSSVSSLSAPFVPDSTQLFPAAAYRANVNDGTNFYLIGGQDAGGVALNDVWVATPPPLSAGTPPQPTAPLAFKLLTNAPFQPRYGAAATALGGNIFLAAGGSSTTNAFNDVWSSVGGVTWTSLGNGPFLPRISAAITVFQGKIILAGGGSSTQDFNDVYFTTNGITWTMLTGAAAWSPRGNPGLTVLSSSLILCGGALGHVIAPVAYNDCSSSSDGVTWSAPVAAPWAARGALNQIVPAPAAPNTIMLVGGYAPGGFYNDVWSLPAGAPLSGWVLSSSSGLPPTCFADLFTSGNQLYVTGGYTTSYAFTYSNTVFRAAVNVNPSGAADAAVDVNQIAAAHALTMIVTLSLFLFARI